MMSSKSATEHTNDRTQATELDDYQLAPQVHREQHSKDGKVYGNVSRKFRSFWNNQISLIVPHESCRDHFGMNEEARACSILPFHTSGHS